MKYFIAVHLIGWFIAEVIDSYHEAVAFHEKQKPIPTATERLATNLELFLWEFTLIPAFIGAWIAGNRLAQKEKDKS